jgi:hypothetical protein
MYFRMQGKSNKNAKKGALLSRVTLVTGITTMMFLVLISASPYGEEEKKEK